MKLTCENLLMVLISAMVLFLLFMLFGGGIAFAQTVAEDGIPNVLKTRTAVNECHTSSAGKIVCGIFKAPDIEKDVGMVQPIKGSPIDPGRRVDELPSFGLAKWHWWLFGFEILPRAQRQYAQCVERISVYEEMLGVPVLSRDGDLREHILLIMDYVVPFEAVQNPYSVKKPPTRKDAIEHVKAALISIDLTVSERKYCEAYRDYLEYYVNARYGTTLGDRR